MKTKLNKTKKRIAFCFILLSFCFICPSQNVANLLAFYRNISLGKNNFNEHWWDTLRVKIPELKATFITAYWLPSPCKVNWEISNIVYDVYNISDLGINNQKGSVENRFVSKAELLNLVSIYPQLQEIGIYTDTVLIHDYREWGLKEESNPAIIARILGKAHNGTNVAHQIRDIHRIKTKNIKPGLYLCKAYANKKVQVTKIISKQLQGTISSLWFANTRPSTFESDLLIIIL